MGPKYEKTWELLCTLMEKIKCYVMDFEGNMRDIMLDRPLLRRALNMVNDDLTYNDRK